MEQNEVLIVDDSRNDFEVLEMGLQRAYNNAITAHHVSRVEDIDPIISENPTIQAVFMDLMLNETDTLSDPAGLHAIERILTEHKTIPVIIITGHFVDTVKKSILQMTLDDEKRIISILDKMDYTNEDLFIAVEQCKKWKELYDAQIMKDILIKEYKENIEELQADVTNKILELEEDRSNLKNEAIYERSIEIKMILESIDTAISFDKKAIKDVIIICGKYPDFIPSFIRVLKNGELKSRQDNRKLKSARDLWEHKQGNFRVYYTNSGHGHYILRIGEKKDQEKIISSLR